MASAKRDCIHIWMPDLLASKGGIQVFSQFVVNAIAELRPEARLCLFA